MTRYSSPLPSPIIGDSTPYRRLRDNQDAPDNASPSTPCFIYVTHFLNCALSSTGRFFYNSPKSWTQLLCYFEGWSVILKGLIGFAINIWTFTHKKCSLPLSISVSSITGLALFVNRGKNAITNNAIFNAQKQLESTNNNAHRILSNPLYLLLKYNAAIGIGIIDYVSACVSINNIFCLLTHTDSSNSIEENKNLVILSALLAIFIPYQFWKFRVSMVDRGTAKFIDHIRKHPCSNIENKHNACTYFLFIFLTLFSTTFFAILNAFLGSSTFRKFCTLANLPSFWHQFGWTDAQFDSNIGFYSAVSGVIITLSNSSAELIPSPRRRAELFNSIKNEGAVKLLLALNIFDLMVNLLLVYSVTSDSPLSNKIPKKFEALKLALTIVLMIARGIPYFLLNISKIVANFGKFKDTLPEGTALKHHGHTLTSDSRIDFNFNIEPKFKSGLWHYPVNEEVATHFLTDHSSAPSLNEQTPGLSHLPV